MSIREGVPVGGEEASQSLVFASLLIRRLNKWKSCWKQNKWPTDPPDDTGFHALNYGIAPGPLPSQYRRASFTRRTVHPRGTRPPPPIYL